MSASVRESNDAGCRELLKLFAPILLMTFSSYLFLFMEKVLLNRLSLDAMEAAVNASYAVGILQNSCVAVVSLAQVFVARNIGSKEWKSIGPAIWQFIWFSLLSTVITIPANLLFGSYYFANTAIEQVVWPYYCFLVGISFLFPLSTTLTCFYLGQGKTKLVLQTMLVSQLSKLFLAYLFIFGVGGWIPAFGILGGPLSTLIAQGGFCLILLYVFLNSENDTLFQSRSWHLKLKLFWECAHTGLLRGFFRMLVFASWAMIARLMTAKGGDYLLFLSIGGTLFIFLPFMGDAICQAQMTLVSQLIGAGRFDLLKKAIRSGNQLSLIIIAIFSIPLLFFPHETLDLFFPALQLEEAVIRKIFLGIWGSFFFFTLVYIPSSCILAFKDMNFIFLMGGMNWINGYLLMYVAIEIVGITADQFWLVLTLMHASTYVMFYWRMKWLQSKALASNNCSVELLA